MENPTVTGLRSRSRSKTPFLRSSCDHENCMEAEEHTHKSGRKTPVKSSTPLKQHGQPSKLTTEVITETVEEYTSPLAHRTRQSMKSTGDNFMKTSDYSSEESLDRLRGHRKEIYQNAVNSQYERASNSRSYSTLDDVMLSPISTSHNLTQDRTSSRNRLGSPAYSVCSTDSSFAEQALADTSLLLTREPNPEHLPSRLYRMAGEYWNKYPKTDYTYSPLSKDRVELAPGQVAMPNMSRRSLSQFRIQGPNTNADEVDRLAATSAWTSTTLRKRAAYKSVDSSDDESAYIHTSNVAEERWWLTRLLITIVTSITATTTDAYRKVVGPSHRYPYTERTPKQANIASRTGSALVAPFYWIYTVINNMITTTVTTVTETVSPNHVTHNEKYIARPAAVPRLVKRRRWPWALLLLLPALAYGSHYTYENWEHLAVPNFTDFQVDLTEFRSKLPEMPNITLSGLNILPKINLTMPDINITLPDISDNLPEVRKTYYEYKDMVQNRMADASDYMQVVAESCYEEMRRYWRGVIG